MLYRYFKLKADEDFERLSELIIVGKCYFPKASSFNDPNEFRFQLRTPSDRQVVFDTWTRDNPDKSNEEFEAWYSSTSFKSWHFALEPELHHEYGERFGVYCLSQSANNPTMWAHYAANHSGICVGFDDLGTHNVPGLIMAGPVRYQTSLPILHYFGEASVDIALKIFLTKCMDWCYEREFRLVARADATLHISPALIREVIFGINTDDAAKARIRSILARRENPIPTREARLSYERYEMEISQSTLPQATHS